MKELKKGYLYILECADGTYYTGSTIDVGRRFKEHQNAQGANHTKKRLPVKLLYVEEYKHVAEAYKREKQVQGWNRRKKAALINGDLCLLPSLAKAHRDLTQFENSSEIE
jgi:putative endonuclease